MRIGNIYYLHYEGGETPYFYIGKGEVHGLIVERFVESPAHCIDPTYEIKIVGIRGNLQFFFKNELPQGNIPNIISRIQPKTEEHSKLIKILKTLQIPVKDNIKWRN